jgi:outer membrane receptor protein involved in Fe transport
MIKVALWGCSAFAFALACVPGAAAAQVNEAGADNANADIVVTAQKREEILQDVPISISVVGGDSLRRTGSTALADLNGYVPGLQIDSSGTPGQTTITLRGIAPLSGSQTVGIYLDDSPVGSSSIYARSSLFSLDLLPYDIERLEVLRGPQGTLYGASSIGGLLKYVTVAPNLQEATGRIGVEGFDIAHGGDLGFTGQGLVSVPLARDKLAISGSFAYRRTPGYIDNVVTGAADHNDAEQLGGRLSLLWQPDEALTVRLSGIYQKTDSENNAQVVKDPATGRRIADGWSNNNLVPEPFETSLRYVSATIDYDFGAATLTSASSYSHNKTVQAQDGSRLLAPLFPLLTGGAVADGLAPFEIKLGLKKFTQELRLASPSDDRFEWLVGAFFTNEKSRNQQTFRALNLDETPIAGLDPLGLASLPSRYREYAVFGNATVKFSEMFEVTGGLRWARNEQRFRQISTGAIVPTADRTGDSAESVLTFSVSPQVHLSEDTMLYGRVATGYRPGGPNVVFPGVPPTVGSDELTSYEVGFKSNLSPAISIDLAAFYLDWTDIQLTVATPQGVNYQVNGPSARSLGVEGSLVLRPVRGLRLGVNASYVDAKLTADQLEIGGLDGDRLPNSPRFSGSLTADYDFRIGDDTARIGVGVRHSGNRLSEVESAPGSVRAMSYTVLDANASYTIDDRWTVRVYARNLTDTRAALTRSLASGQDLITPLQPRTIGLAAEMVF